MEVPMDPTDTRLKYVFGGDPGTDWGLTLEGFAQALRQRDPQAFTRVWDDPADGPSAGTTMSFGFVVDGMVLEGIAKSRPQGVMLDYCNVSEATEFAVWLRRHVVPVGVPLEFISEPALEWGMSGDVVPEGTAEDITRALLAHLARVEEADRRLGPV